MIRITTPDAGIDRFRDFITHLGTKYQPCEQVQMSAYETTYNEPWEPIAYTETLMIDGEHHCFELDLKTGRWSWVCYPRSLD